MILLLTPVEQSDKDLLCRFPPPKIVKSIVEFQEARLDHLAFQLENGYGVRVDVLAEYEDLNGRYRIWHKIYLIQEYENYDYIKELPAIIPAPYNLNGFTDANR